MIKFLYQKKLFSLPKEKLEEIVLNNQFASIVIKKINGLIMNPITLLEDRKTGNLETMTIRDENGNYSKHTFVPPDSANLFTLSANPVRFSELLKNRSSENAYNALISTLKTLADHLE